MTRAARQRYLRGIIDAPSVLVAAGWIALWLVWPASLRRPARAAALPPSRVFLVASPNGEAGVSFAPRVSAAALSALDESSGLADGLSGPIPREPRYLAREAAAFARPGGGPLAPVLEKTAADRGAFEPVFRVEPVFARLDRPPGGLVCEPGGDLRRAGFDLPADADARAAEFAQPWQVTAYVSVGEDGAVEDVFFLEPVEPAEVRDFALRALLRGRLARPGAARTGRVTLSYEAP